MHWLVFCVFDFCNSLILVTQDNYHKNQYNNKSYLDKYFRIATKNHKE